MFQDKVMSANLTAPSYNPCKCSGMPMASLGHMDVGTHIHSHKHEIYLPQIKGGKTIVLFLSKLHLGLHDAIFLTSGFLFTLDNCVNFKPMSYDSTKLE